MAERQRGHVWNGWWAPRCCRTDRRWFLHIARKGCKNVRHPSKRWRRWTFGPALTNGLEWAHTRSRDGPFKSTFPWKKDAEWLCLWRRVCADRSGEAFGDCCWDPTRSIITWNFALNNIPSVDSLWLFWLNVPERCVLVWLCDNIIRVLQMTNGVVIDFSDLQLLWLWLKMQSLHFLRLIKMFLLIG